MRLEWITKFLNASGTTRVRDVEITGLAYDSRQVKPGYLFVAVPGHAQDGAQFIDDALTRGAVAVVGEQATWAHRHVPYIQVPDARIALADLASMFFQHPSSRLEVIGITGTNGKTTVSFMIRALLEAAGRAPGLIGTVRYEIGQRRIPAARTTPEAPDVQAMMQKMEQAGCRSVVMEVSSHALDQHRVRGVDFDVAVFTNLTRDHLDYHGSMDRYFDAKTALFRQLGGATKHGVAIINRDDPWSEKLMHLTDGPSAQLTYGAHPDADIRAESIHLDRTGSRFTVHTPWGTADVHLSLLGRFNISNALAAIAAGGARGLSLESMVEVLSRPLSVPGRLEPVANKLGFNVFVDYAHTDDALSNVLGILREITPGRILLVFGCGGDRDRSKRPAMGAVADRGADYSFITSDNPRREDPQAIVAEIEHGFQRPDHHVVLLNREEAIAAAIHAAQPGDAVLIAGKGHETYQDFGHTVIPFDDVEVAKKILTGKERSSRS
jgi:UDP-N-acetylmuramoyl-L-alanyl-D-glutamate--2,6-diaminopimelate ligase